MAKKEEANILVIDDDEAILTSAKMFLKQKFTYVHTLSSPSNIRTLLREVSFDIVLLDMNFSRGENTGEEGLDLIDQIFSMKPTLDIIPITAYGEIDLAVEAVRRGARDFLTKPWNNDKLLKSIENALRLRHSEKTNQASALTPADKSFKTGLIGRSRAIQKILAVIEKVAKTDANILILGENGTGKELVAEAIHQQSLRGEQEITKVDLGSLTPTLFESELFGHKKGAFTDAKNDREGKFQQAHLGTLFLDEIGNLAIDQQSKLLTAIQSQSISPVGSNVSITVDTRIICATNANLMSLVKNGQFRQDLLYRINTIEIEVPPLRERIEDIPVIFHHYFNLFKKKYGKKQLKIDQGCISSLQEHSWPGNIRELIHATERAIIMSENILLTINDFNLTQNDAQNEPQETSLDLKDMEKTLILKALEKHKGNITHAAKDLGIDRLALYRRLEKYGL